jgi:hypothetical protein
MSGLVYGPQLAAAIEESWLLQEEEGLTTIVGSLLLRLLEPPDPTHP